MLVTEAWRSGETWPAAKDFNFCIHTGLDVSHHYIGVLRTGADEGQNSVAETPHKLDLKIDSVEPVTIPDPLGLLTSLRDLSLSDKLIGMVMANLSNLGHLRDLVFAEIAGGNHSGLLRQSDRTATSKSTRQHSDWANRRESFCLPNLITLALQNNHQSGGMPSFEGSPTSLHGLNL